jgi:hypothetical protein
VPRIIAVVDKANQAWRRLTERIGRAKVEAIEAHGRPHPLFAARRRWCGA